MRNLILTLTVILSINLSANTEPSSFDPKSFTLEELSQELLKTIKAEKSTTELEALYKNLTVKRLSEELTTDKQKIAFWVNTYNEFIQIKLNANPSLYEDRGRFFSMKQIAIAGRLCSFEKLEHGIIRRSQKPAGLGYVKKIFPGRFERKLRVGERDHRVHFALNCGAKSCPPVGIYSSAKLDEELNYMGTRYLKNNTTYDADTKIVKSTTLFSWFRGDFGGLDGAKQILKNEELIPSTDVKLEFNDYDWTLLTNQFVDIKL